MIGDISRMMADLYLLWRWWLAGEFGNQTMRLSFVSWYNDTGSEFKLYATYWNSNPNTVLDKHCLCLRYHGSKLFSCIPEHNDFSWYKSLSCINDLNCSLPSPIIADIVTYISFGKLVDNWFCRSFRFWALMDLLVKLHTFLRFYVSVEFTSKAWGIFMMAITIFNFRSKCIFKLINNLSNFHTICLPPKKAESSTLLAKLLSVELLIVQLFCSWIWSNAIVENTLLVLLKQPGAIKHNGSGWERSTIE